MNCDYDDWLYEQTKEKIQDDPWLPMGCLSILGCAALYYLCILLFTYIVRWVDALVF